MWSRRSLLATAGVSLLSVGVAGKLRTGSPNPDRFLDDVRVDERTLEADGDARPERVVRVQFVPRRRLVAVRLEARVTAATDTALADRLDRDDDGWYVVARRTRLGHEHRGTAQSIRASPGRRVAGVDDRWLAESHGFRPGSTGVADVRGFERGDVLRLVAVPYDDDPVVVAEHAVGVDD
jgi:hypothetical protein